MNEIEKQILLNQHAKMNVLFVNMSHKGKNSLKFLMEQIKETSIILHPKEEQSLPEKTKDALGRKEE